MTDLHWGLWMTGMGMGVVFALLLLLMLLLMLIGRLDRAPRAVPEPAPGAADRDVPAPAADAAEEAPAVRILADGLTEDELAAISVAVLVHRDIRRSQAAPETRAKAPGSQLSTNRWVSAGRALQTSSRLTRRY